MIKLTALRFEALVQATEEPKPLPLPLKQGIPLLPFWLHPDWSTQIRLRTTWETDVTRSVNQVGERLCLKARPARQLQIKVTCGKAEEADALYKTVLQNSSEFGLPVPIFPDLVQVKAAVIDGLTYRLVGNFRYRRFFRGGRVAIMRNVPRLQQSLGDVLYATILEVTPTQLRILLDQGSLRLIDENDIVFPCIDAEALRNTNADALTDGVSEVELTWDEVAGESTLPASWPAISHGDASNLEPICQIVGNRPVFPFDPNWADGVRIRIVRDADSDRVGLTEIQDLIGRPFHSFQLTVQGYNREACWRVVRFFDAVRGRMASFWFLHPQSLWEVQNLTLNRVTVKAAGSLDGMQKYRHVAFLRADGTVEIRPIASVIEDPGVFYLDFSSPLPDTDFVAAKPAFVCYFSSDSLEEGWDTDEVVPALDLEIEEDPSDGATAPSSLGIGYLSAYTSFQAIPGNNLLLRAGSGMLDLDGKTSYPWQIAGGARGSIPAKWRDQSRAIEQNPLRPRIDKAVDANLEFPFPELILPNPSWRNNGQPYVRDSAFFLSYQQDPSIPILDKQLWSTQDGWTIVVVTTPYTWLTTPSNRYWGLFDISSPEFGLSAAIDTVLATGNDRGNVTWALGATSGFVPFTRNFSGTNSSNVFIFRIADGVLRAWGNGLPLIPATPIGMADASSFNPTNSILLFQTTANYAGPTSPAIIDAMWGNQPGACLFASYGRGLSVSELNQLQLLCANQYAINLVPLSLY